MPNTPTILWQGSLGSLASGGSATTGTPSSTPPSGALEMLVIFANGPVSPNAISGSNPISTVTGSGITWGTKATNFNPGGTIATSGWACIAEHSFANDGNADNLGSIMPFFGVATGSSGALTVTLETNASLAATNYYGIWLQIINVAATPIGGNNADNWENEQGSILQTLISCTSTSKVLALVVNADNTGGISFTNSSVEIAAQANAPTGLLGTVEADIYWVDPTGGISGGNFTLTMNDDGNGNNLAMIAFEIADGTGGGGGGGGSVYNPPMAALLNLMNATGVQGIP